MSSQTLLAIAALVSSLASVGMLALHCWRDHKRFRELGK
jgi:hypothetical protein